jgi:hypothetical protein
MDVYSLSRSWFNFCFENPDLIKPNHTAILFFAIEHCNRLAWKNKFGFPTTMAMEAIGIKSYNTYIESFNQLVEWGFIKLIEKSKNQYSANIIALSENNKAHSKALDKAFIKHGSKQDESTSESIDSINKQIYKDTIIQDTNIQYENVFEIFRKKYPGTKLGLKTEFDNFKKHKDWKDVLKNLESILLKQIEVKTILIDKKQFVPEWKNLKTWINQRCWEEEFKEIKETAKSVYGQSISDKVDEAMKIIQSKESQ